MGQDKCKGHMKKQMKTKFILHFLQAGNVQLTSDEVGLQSA